MEIKKHSDEHYMQLALLEAERAGREGEIPVGAVIVRNGEVIAAACNEKEALNDPTAHAELNAIRRAVAFTGDWRLTDASLYVTKEPCVMCAGAMINARLGRLVFGCSDERFGAVTSTCQLLMGQGFNHEVRVLSGVLAKECADILQNFFVKLRSG
ncbi:MAG: nucleoside deaminase [Nitrospira sp.]|nr:nucleoside deaminase [Nitrospira sp.]